MLGIIVLLAIVAFLLGLHCKGERHLPSTLTPLRVRPCPDRYHASVFHDRAVVSRPEITHRQTI
jgi:hypothetical protein